MKDQYTRERVLAVLVRLSKRTRENPATVKELQEEIVQMMTYHQAIDRRAIYKDLEAIQNVGIPITILRGPNNRILSYYQTEEEQHAAHHRQKKHRA